MKYQNLTIIGTSHIAKQSLKEVTEAGANNIVAGSYITNADDPVEQIKSIFRQFS